MLNTKKPSKKGAKMNDHNHKPDDQKPSPKTQAVCETCECKCDCKECECDCGCNCGCDEPIIEEEEE